MNHSTPTGLMFNEKDKQEITYAHFKYIIPQVTRGKTTNIHENYKQVNTDVVNLSELGENIFTTSTWTVIIRLSEMHRYRKCS